MTKSRMIKQDNSQQVPTQHSVLHKMSKSSQSKKLSPVPNTDQIAAVRRLADGGDTVQARQRLAALRKAFPDFKPLLGLAWEVEDRCGAPMIASARAYEWQRAAPNSRMAVEALCDSSRAAGLAAVHACALARLRAMDGLDDEPVLDVIDSPLGALSLEQAQAIDLSRMYLTDDNPAAAAAVLQGVDHPSARNNLALALFITGDMAQARSVIEANWQEGPNNLFALERALRWRCWAEGLDRCMGFSATLLYTVPRRVEDAVARVAALRFLGDEKGARLAWEDSEQAPYWSQATDGQLEMFATLKESGVELPGDSGLWFPSPWIRALTAISGKHKGAQDPQWEQLWNSQLETCDAHADYLTRAVELGDAVVRQLALAVLKRRAKRSDALAISGLQTVLKRPCGSDSVRMDLLNWLIEEGLRSRDEPVEVWLTGNLRTIRSYGLTITDEPRPSPFPPAGTAINERVHEAIRLGNSVEALSLAQQLQQMCPDQPSALTNLAAVKESLGHPAAQITALYRQANVLAPDYLFARCGLARCLAREGSIEEARTLLDGILERQEFHRSEYRSFLMAQRALALASGEQDAARNLGETLVDLDKDLED